MSGISFPFWIIARHRSLVSIPLESNTFARHALCFSTSKQAAQCMLARHFTAEWEVKMISRPLLGAFVQDLEQLGFEGLCYDEQPDGTRGTCVRLADLQGD